MFIAALFTIVKIWKQPKCPLIDEWIKKMWYTYTMEYYLAIKNNEILPFVTIWTDLGRIPGTAEPGGLLSMGSHKVGHD